MASRYWVGGTGTWDTTTTHWAATSGGAAGATAPTATDDVFIDGSSGSPVITLTGTLNCLSLTTTGATCTLTSTGSLTVAGSITLSATTTWSNTGALSISGTCTLTTNGVTLTSSIVINTAGITVTLGSALSTNVASASFNINLYQGTFNTNNFNVTLTGAGGGLQTQAALTKSLILGTSTINITNSSIYTAWSVPNSATTTVSAASSTINITATASTTGWFGGVFGMGFNGGNYTYGNVTLTNNLTQTSTIACMQIEGTNTFTNLTLVNAANTTKLFLIRANQTVTGTFTAVSATANLYKILIYGDPFGTARTITAAAVSLTDVDFRDITGAGTASPFTGTRIGNPGGNSGITFTAAKTVYWNNTTASAWNTASWATSSGGAVSAANYPLPQDTAIISNTGSPAAFSSINSIFGGNAAYQCYPSTLDASGRTTSLYFNAFNAGCVAGAFGNTTFTGCGNLTLDGGSFWLRTDMPFNGANYPIFSLGLILYAITTATRFYLTSNYVPASISFSSITVYSGTFDLNAFNFTAPVNQLIFNLYGGVLNVTNQTLTIAGFGGGYAGAALPYGCTTATRSITFGTTGAITCTTTGTYNLWDCTDATSLSFTGTSTVNISNNSATAPAASGLANGFVGGSAANAFNFNITVGTYTLTPLATFWCGNLNFTGFTGTWAQTSTIIYGNLTLVAGMAVTPSTSAINFQSGGTQTITSAGKTLGAVTINKTASQILTLNDNLTVGTTYTFTLTQGILNLNNFTLSTGLFSSTNSFGRAIQFGTGNITCTGSGTVWTTSIASNFTYTGTSTINITNATTTAVTAVHGLTSGSATNALNFYVSGGAYTISLQSSLLGSLTFAAGWAGTWTSQATYFYGDLTCVSTMTIGDATAGNPLTFQGTTGTQTITTGGKNMPRIVILTTGSTVVLVGNANFAGGLIGTAYYTGFTLTSGTFNANGYNVSADSYILTTGTLIMGSGTWSATATRPSQDLSVTYAITSQWRCAAAVTITANTSTISLTSNSTAFPCTFAGGGKTYYNLLFSSTTGNTNFVITGANTFNSISSNKTVVYILTLPASTTTTVGTFSAQGSAGNYFGIVSSIPGTNSILSVTNSFSLDYTNVQDNTLITSNGTVTNGFLGRTSGWTYGTNSIGAICLTTGTAVTLPADFSSTNTIHLIGGGGGGATGSGKTSASPYTRAGGGGGGGGGYAQLINQSYSPGQVIAYSIGLAGVGASGSGGTVSTGGTGGTTSWGASQNTISYVSSVISVQNTLATTITVTVPAVSNGNLMVMIVNSANTTNTWITPVGWTIGTTGANGTALFWRIASSEPVSYTVTQSLSNRADAFIIAYTNATFSTSGLSSQTAAATVTPAAITVASTNSTIIYAASNIGAGSATFTTPTGYTARASDSDTSSPSAAIFDLSLVAAGSYTAPSTTTSTGTAYAFVISLSPTIGSYTTTATGGLGGSNDATIPSSTGGAGGTGVGGSTNYIGGTGGAGGTTSITVNVGLGSNGGGGGGAAGPNGNGANGGNGLAGTGNSAAGGGGGGSGGGTAGGNATFVSPNYFSGAGGNNSSGTGGGASSSTTPNNATAGGGGGSGSVTPNYTGGSGYLGTDIAGLYGAGGGGGGSSYQNAVPALIAQASGTYGAGGFGGGSFSSTSLASTSVGGSGAQGVIVITYTPIINNNTGNFLLLF